MSTATTIEPKNAYLSEVDPEFAPFIPGLNDAFKQIWTFNDVGEFRGKFANSRTTYAPYVPEAGFEVVHRKVAVRDGTELEIRIYRPESAKGVLPLLYAIHGGGWVVGTHDTEAVINRCVCVKNGMAVISVDYRRAPEHRYPTALNDAYDVLKWIIAHASEVEVDASKIIVGGSSSGANLVAATVLRARDAGIKGIIGQVLNIPALCHPQHYPGDKYELLSFEQNRNSPTTNSAHMTWFWRQYLPNAEPSPDASPLLASSHAGLPPTLIQVAGLDPLRDEGIAYAKALEAAGVPVTLKAHKGVPHGFMFITTLKATTEYSRNVVEWVSALLKSAA